MPNLNKVMLMGNLTRDPISRSLASGSTICEFGVAVNRRYRTAQGEDREEVCYADIEVWGKTADNCNRYLHKGSPVYLEGRLRMDQWTDKATNQPRTRLKIVAENITFLESRPQNGQGPDYRGGAAAYGQQVQNGGNWRNDAPPPPPPPNMEIIDDEYTPGF